MKSGIPLLLLSGALLACAKKNDSGGAKAVPNPDSWPIYEDNLFRVAYPPNSDVAGAPEGKQDPQNPVLGVVPPPAAGNSVIGGFFLQADKASKGMLLRDGIEAELKKAKGARGVLLAPAKEISVGNGRCLGSIVIIPTANCAKNSGSCFAPVFSVLCDGPNGSRYTAGTVLSSSSNRDRLSPQAQQEAAVYERILRSLEFKKS